MNTLRSLLLPAVCATLLPAQNEQTWSRGWLSSRSGSAWVHEDHSNRTLLIGGFDGTDTLDDTWAWDGSRWTSCQRATSVQARRGHAVAFDPIRHRVVVFGGDGGAGLRGDTMEWTGTRWLARTASGPTARTGAVMVFHAGSGKTVLFGGDDGANQLGDTWEWDGTAWTQRMPANSPPARVEAGMVYDSARDRLVLFGGRAGGIALADTWEWDGTDWTQASPSNVPNARSDFGTAFDPQRGRTVIHGGIDGTTLLDDTWEWDGADWTDVSPNPRTLNGRHGQRMTFVPMRGRIVLFGGFTGIYDETDLWEWDGTAWTQLSPAEAPAPRQYPIMAYDSLRDRVVMYGGRVTQTDYFDDTWVWDENGWQQLFPNTVAPEREDLDLAYDSARDRMVMFGGHDSVQFFDETWEFDGTDWIQRFPANKPSPRAHHQMVYDPVRNLTILYGGVSPLPARIPLGDTWIWDGNDWTEVFPRHSPGPRLLHDMTWDPVTQRVLIHGGTDFTRDYGDLHAWNGSDWIRVFYGNASPPVRRDHRFEYDTRRGKILMAGGWQMTGDTWELDPSSVQWTRINPVRSTNLDHAFVMAHHQGSGRTVGFGGRNAAGRPVGVTWVYRLDKVSEMCSFGSGCAGTVGAHSLRLTTDPPTLGQSFTVEASPVVPGTFAIAVFGWSQTVDGSLPLPANLASLGMPECYQLVSVFSTIPPTTFASAPTWTIQVPNDLSYVDTVFYLQSFCLDANANPAGAVASNALEGVIGMRP